MLNFIFLYSVKTVCIVLNNNKLDANAYQKQVVYPHRGKSAWINVAGGRGDCGMKIGPRIWP